MLPLPLPVMSSAKTSEDTVEMQSIESFKLKETPSPIIPKPPPTYFAISATSSPPSSANGSPRHVAVATKTQLNGNTKELINSQAPMEKYVAKFTNGAITTPCSGKVAVRIGAYEGETKQPSRLEFLPQQSPTVVDSPVKISGESVANRPVVSRLQNELAATLERSNLRKKTDTVKNQSH